MNVTKLMRADEIAVDFNAVTDREYWRASVGGTRVNPEVHFNSRASMVRVIYRVATSDFTLQFSRTNAAFGDFLASAHRSLAQVLSSLKAAGLPFSEPLDERAVLRIEYNPKTKGCTIHMAGEGDEWLAVETLPFKVPQRTSLEKLGEEEEHYGQFPGGPHMTESVDTESTEE